MSELCAGTCSALQHLQADPTAQVMAFDILPIHKILPHIPSEHRSRFTYTQIDIRDLSIDSLQKIVYDNWSISLDGVDHWHVSVPCQTYSVAHHGHNYHRNGLLPLTAKARAHDEILNHSATLFRQLATHNPRALLSMENPTGLWASMPSIQSCARQPDWVFLPSVHYCANTSEADGPFPKKPTSFLIFGVPSSFTLSECNNDCPHRISADSPLHKRVLCRHSYTRPEQTVITDVDEKGKIPTFLFQQMWHAHRGAFISAVGGFFHNAG